MSLPVLLNVQSVSPPLTGIGFYTRHLVEGLYRQPERIALRCFRDVGLVDAPVPDSDGGLPRPPPEPLDKAIVPPALRAHVARIPAVRRIYHRWRRRNAWRDIHAIKDGLYHEPNNVLERIDLPSVVTVHDLSTIHYPEHHPEDRIRYFRRRWPVTVERARHIIAVSEFTRRDVIETLDVPPERVTAIPNGVSKAFAPHPVEEVAPTLLRYALMPGRYVLSVGTVEPRKNLRTLLAAYRAMPTALRRRYPLVLAGSLGWGDDEFAQHLHELAHRGEIRLLGYVPDHDLPLLYAGAAAFGYLSIYEGFGLPVLEALASGIPTLTSQGTVMEEVAGEAAALVPALDSDAAAEALRRLLEDEQLRARLAAAGPRRASAFSWDRMLAETVAVYERAAG